MPPDTIWTDQSNKSDIKLSIRGVEWKNLVNECLMATEIKKKQCFSDKRLNPNVVMSIRHQVAKECVKAFPIPGCQIQSEAKKLIRGENKTKLLRNKEEKLIKKEINKLKEILDLHGMLTKKNLESDEKCKHEQQPKTVCRVVKLWVTHASKQYRMEKIKHPETSEKTIQETEKMEPTSMRKGSFINENNEPCNEISSRRKKKRAEAEERKMTKVEVKSFLPLLDVMNQKKMDRAWRTWRIYIQRQKRREREMKMYVDKIEAFLSKLQQSGGKTKAKLRVRGCKQEQKTCKLFLRAKTAIDDEERQEKLRKLMREVETSQTELSQKLRPRRESKGKAFPNPKFLSQMEQRHEESLKRWKHIQEQKQKLKEEKENIEKRKEEERKQKAEQEKHKRMEELKETRRAEKERKEEQRKKKDMIIRDQFLAKAHYRKFLLKSHGLRPWIKLMKLTKAQYEQAVEFHDRRLLLMFGKWRVSIKEQVEKKTRCAEQLYTRNLLKCCWRSLVALQMERVGKNQVAMDWNDFKLAEKVFRRWKWFAEKEQIEYGKKKKIAECHHKRKLKIKYLQKLIIYPERKKEEQEREIRKLKWRQKVKEILPNYQPMEITQDW